MSDKHIEKIKLARKMITPAEISAHKSIFLSKQWIKRSLVKKNREIAKANKKS